jgi:hypothetical protein
MINGVPLTRLFPINNCPLLALHSDDQQLSFWLALHSDDQTVVPLGAPMINNCPLACCIPMIRLVSLWLACIPMINNVPLSALYVTQITSCSLIALFAYYKSLSYHHTN